MKDNFKFVFEEIFGGFTAKMVDLFALHYGLEYTRRDLERIFQRDDLQKYIDKLLRLEVLIITKNNRYTLNPEAKSLTDYIDCIAKRQYRRLAEENKQ